MTSASFTASRNSEKVCGICGPFSVTTNLRDHEGTAPEIDDVGRRTRPDEAERILGVNEKTVREQCKRHEIKVPSIGGVPQ